jgi:hypothetical protein
LVEDALSFTLSAARDRVAVGVQLAPRRLHRRRSGGEDILEHGRGLADLHALLMGTRNEISVAIVLGNRNRSGANESGGDKRHFRLGQHDRISFAEVVSVTTDARKIGGAAGKPRAKSHIMSRQVRRGKAGAIDSNSYREALR